MSSYYLALVLHAHLPFVRHPEKEWSAEEGWLFQAITESYIPLIEVLRGLVRDGVSAPLTFSLSPSLLGMLNDPSLRSRYDRHLERFVQLIEREARRAEDDAQRELIRFYRDRANTVRSAWQNYDGNLGGQLKRLAEQGAVELFTCGATHGYLPLLQQQPQVVWAL